MGLLRQYPLQVSGIALSHFRRQRNQRGAIIERGAISRVTGRQLKEIAAPKLDGACPIDLERPLLTDGRIKAMLAEKLLDGFFRQFDSQDLMALMGEPKQIQAFST